MIGCDAFRERLERELAGQVRADEMRALAWHEHLLACGACRALLEAEQALEELLASLPTPQLSPAVARRVLARLRELRRHELVDEDVRLDALLELDLAAPPGDLARSVLAGLQGERAARDPERALDLLLELDVAAPPEGLAARVLAGLAPRRRAPRAAPAQRVARRALPIAAAALVALGGWALWPAASDAPVDDHVASVAGAAEPTPEMLAALDVLEEWDLLMDMEQDLDLLFSTLEPADELLLEYQDGAGGEPGRPLPEQAPVTDPPALPPSAGPSRGSKG